MTGDPKFFVMERGAGGKPTPALYFGALPLRLTRKIPRDNRGLACEPNPIIYALRLDRLAEDDPWRTRSLNENYTAWLVATHEGKELPPSNLADPPRAPERKGRVLGEYWEPSPMPRPVGWDQAKDDAALKERLGI